jgi:hypothetical protein
MGMATAKAEVGVAGRGRGGLSSGVQRSSSSGGGGGGGSLAAARGQQRQLQIGVALIKSSKIIIDFIVFSIVGSLDIYVNKINPNFH